MNEEKLLRLADEWTQEEPPPGLATATFQAVEHESRATTPWMERLDRLVAPIIYFFEGPRHPLATGLATLVVGSLLMLSVLAPNMARSRAQAELSACKANLKNVSVALDAYQGQRGHYPQRLEELLSGYLKAVPSCPAADADTYSEGYTQASERYTVSCSGRHHRTVEVGENYPQYSSEAGSIER